MPASARPSAAAALAPVGLVRLRARVTDQVYEELAEAIRTLRLPPGAPLTEKDLAATMHVSRSPIREAIARLVADGMVTVAPQVGTNVARISRREVGQARFVRESLEVSAFTAACAAPDRDTRMMRALLDRQSDAREAHDFEAFFAADEAFHRELFVICGFPGVWAAMQSATFHLDRLRRLTPPDTDVLRRLIDEHTAIADAVEAGVAQAGRVHLVRHIRRIRQNPSPAQETHPEYFTE